MEGVREKKWNRGVRRGKREVVEKGKKVWGGRVKKDWVKMVRVKKDWGEVKEVREKNLGVKGVKN